MDVDETEHMYAIVILVRKLFKSIIPTSLLVLYHFNSGSGLMVHLLVSFILSDNCWEAFLHEQIMFLYN